MQFKTWVLLLLLSSCVCVQAALDDKFKGERREDAVSFAERTHDLFFDDYFSVLDERWGLHYRLIADVHAEETSLRETTQRVSALLMGIKLYSQQVLVIAESGQSDSDKAKALAAYLSERVPALALALSYEEQHYDGLISAISKQKNLREALRSAQPLFDDAEALMKLHLAKLEQQIAVVENQLLQQLNSQFAPVLALHEKIVARKRPLLERLATQLPNKLAAADQAELHYLNELQNLIGDDYNHLLQGRQLLDQAKKQLFNDVARVRSVMAIWVRAHGKMSKGIYHSAEWFEIEDLPKRLVKKIGL